MPGPSIRRVLWGPMHWPGWSALVATGALPQPGTPLSRMSMPDIANKQTSLTMLKIVNVVLEYGKRALASLGRGH